MSEGNMNTMREKILASDDILRELVEVPEWGVVVEVRSMNGAERTRILDQAIEEGGKMNLQLVYPEVVIASAFDPETGAQIFTPADRDALQQKNALATDRLAQVGLRLGGFTEESVDAVGKSSSETEDAASSSDSLNPSDEQ